MLHKQPGVAVPDGNFGGSLHSRKLHRAANLQFGNQFPARFQQFAAANHDQPCIGVGLQYPVKRPDGELRGFFAGKPPHGQHDFFRRFGRCALKLPRIHAIRYVEHLVPVRPQLHEFRPHIR